MSSPARSTSGLRSALVITFDQFPASILGCYGNEWIETPEIDRLAANGMVADECWADRTGPASAEDLFSANRLVSALKERSVRTYLFLEAESQVDFTGIAFDQRQVIRGELGPTAKPDRIPLAQLVQKATAAWSKEQAAGNACLIWIHARGIMVPAFPPAGFADLYQDEFEDREVNFEKMSEDERWHHPAVTAGMASLLDHWIGRFFSSLGGDAESPAGLKVLTAAQGVPWQRLPNSFGPLDELCSQSAHVPWVIQTVGDARFNSFNGTRTDRLCSPRDLGHCLERWFHENFESADEKSQITTIGPSGNYRITTKDWSAIFPATVAPTTENDPQPLLFRRPEDAWEVNNLAEVSPEVVARLRGLFQETT